MRKYACKSFFFFQVKIVFNEKFVNLDGDSITKMLYLNTSFAIHYTAKKLYVSFLFSYTEYLRLVIQHGDLVI